MSVQLEVERILRVDHAGEKGAIGIYRAQIFVSKFLWSEHVPELEEMLTHEKKHFSIFDTELKQRGVRSCYALPLWSLGGILLGSVTALLGPNTIWACTAAVEKTVTQHLKAQMEFLGNHDLAALKAVASIEEEELSHLQSATSRLSAPSLVEKGVSLLVSKSTFVAIWLSERL